MSAYQSLSPETRARISSGVQAAFGAVEVVSGFGTAIGTCAVTVGLGCVAGVAQVVNGIDNLFAGGRTVYDGRVQETFLHQGLVAAGSTFFSDENAQRLAVGVSMVASMGTNVFNDGIRASGKFPQAGAASAKAASLSRKHAAAFAKIEAASTVAGAGIGYAATLTRVPPGSWMTPLHFSPTPLQTAKTCRLALQESTKRLSFKLLRSSRSGTTPIQPLRLPSS